MFKENLGLKLFALSLAILIWLQSVLVMEHKSKVNLPVRLNSLPADISLENMPTTIPFSVEGKGLDILRLAISRPVANIDASGLSAGLDLISLQNYAINIPENNKVKILGPADNNKIAVQTDVLLKKSVSVKLAFKDRQAQSELKEYQYHISPEKVTLHGPKNKVQLVSQLHTEEITTDMLKQKIIELPLAPIDSDISLSESSVLLTISGSQESTKVVSNILLPDGYMLGSVAARIQGSAEDIKSLTAAKIKAIVSEEPDERDMYEIELEVPEGLRVLAITPNKVRKRGR